jgi:hypothetical protein
MYAAIIEAIVAFFKALFGLKPKDPMQEVLKDNLQAKVNESEAMAAPDRDKSAIVSSMQSRVEH